MKKLFLLALATAALVSCESVGPKERGIRKEWGGQVNTSDIYQPGMSTGLSWLMDDMITFDITEKTHVEKYQFNDLNNMATGVEVSVDYQLDPSKVGLFYTKVSDFDVKLKKTIQSAAKEVIPQYSAADLNLTKRNEAETKISALLAKELPQYYVIFNRIQILDVDIPKTISDAAEATAEQAELNKLAAAKEKEAENNYKAAEWDAKTKDVLSKPAMLELKRLEIQMEYAKQGVSPYGQNNVFGGNADILLNRR